MELTLKQINEIITKTSAVESAGQPGQWKAICPAHNDTKPSLSINSDIRKINCLAGCDFKDILNTLNIKVNNSISEHYENHNLPLGNYYPHLSNNNRNLAYQKTKLHINRTGNWYSEKGSKKSWIPFLQRNDNKKHKNIIIAEGIWDGMAVYNYGWNAITPSNGCSQDPDNNLLELCQNKTVAIIYDKDEGGRTGQKKIYSYLALKKINCAIVEWPTDLKQKYDLSDWLKEHSIEDIEQHLTKPNIDYLNDTDFVTALKEFDDLLQLINPVAIYSIFTMLGIDQKDYIKSLSYVNNQFKWTPKGPILDFKALYIAKLLALVHIRYVKTENAYYKYNGKWYDPIDLGENVYYILQNINASKRYASKDNAFTQTEVALRTNSIVENPLPENPTDIICFRNYLYDINSYQKKEHTADIVFTHVFDYDYDDTKQFRDSRFQKFLGEIIPNRKERHFLQEFCGYTFQQELQLEKAILLVGNGSNGKSTLLKLLKMLFGGTQNVSSLSLKQLAESRFSVSELRGKLANIAADISSSWFDEALFKTLISGDSIKFEQKFGDQTSFESHAKFYLSCNELPKIRDTSFAMWRRISLIEFPNTFTNKPTSNNEKQINPNLLHELTVELPIVFNWAMRGLKRLRKNDYFYVVESIEKRIANYKLESNKLFDFYTECLEFKEGEEESFTTIFEEYTKWCESNKVAKNNRVASRSFGKYLTGINEKIRKISGKAGKRYIINVYIRD